MKRKDYINTNNGAIPNIINGGFAERLYNDMFLLNGRKHSKGGIDIGDKLEAEGGEIIFYDNNDNPNEEYILSAQPMINVGNKRISPAQFAMITGNKGLAFTLQQQYNKNHHQGDFAKCGTKRKAEDGTEQKVNTSKDNGLLSFIRNLFTDDTQVEEINNTPAPINFEEVAARQAFMESEFNPQAMNNKKAVGVFQIRQNALDDYNKKNKTNYTLDDLKDEDTNIKVRNWLIDDLYNANFINKPNQSDSVRVAKTLGAYNWGRGNMAEYLNRRKAEGDDIYNDMGFIENLPEETRNYIEFILRNNDVNRYKNNEQYDRAKNKHNTLYDKIVKSIFDK